MANTAVSSTDISNIRAGNHVIRSVRLNIVQPQEVTTLSVTGVPTTVPYATLNVSGTLTSVSEGQLVKIYDANHTKAWSVVRKAPSTGLLHLAPLSLGDPGVPAQIEYAIESGDSAVVYTHRPLWSLYSSIQQRVFYKKWDVPYTDQNSLVPPMANAGAWQAARTTGVGANVFTLPRRGINTSFAMVGGSLTYAWALPTGVTLRAGYSLTDDVIKVDADGGQHLVALTVTDGNSKTHTAYTWLFSENDDYRGFGQSYIWGIEGDTQSREGREISFRVVGDDLRDVLLPGAGVLVTETSTFNGYSLSPGVLVDTFIGYITGDINYSNNGRYGEATFTAKSPFLVANDLPIPPQLLTEESVPADWTQCNSTLSNPRGALYYAIKWHCPALIDMHDFDAPYTEPRKKSYEYNTSSLGDAMKVASGALPGGSVGSASDGTLVLRRNAMLEDNDYRNGLETVWTWLPRDVKPPFKYGGARWMKAGEVRGGAFAYDGSNIGGYAVVKRWYQGTGRETMANFTVTMSDGLEKAKRVIGHYMAMLNARVGEISVEIMSNLDIVDPAYLDAWHKSDIRDEFDPEGIGFVNTRLLPVRVERNWEFRSGTAGVILKRITAAFQPETYGQPGEEDPIGSAQTGFDGGGSGWNTVEPVPYEMEQAATPSIMLVGNTAGNVAITYNFQDASPLWTNLTDFFSEVCDACLDYNSDYFTNGRDITLPIGVYVASTVGTTVKVSRIEDFANPATDITLLTTFTMADETSPHTVRIQCSETEPELVSVIWKDQRGTRISRSTDGGTTWAAESYVSAVISDSALNNDLELGLSVEGSDVLATAPNSAGEYSLYKATSGGSFSLLTGSPTINTPQPTVIPDGEDRLYVSVPNDQGLGYYTVTFDSGGYANYSLEPSGGGWTHVANASGNPGNAFGATSASASFAHGPIMYVTAPGGGWTIVSYSVDIYINWTSKFPTSFANTLYLRMTDGGSLNSLFVTFNITAAGVGNGMTVTSGTGDVAGDYRAAWHTVSSTHQTPFTGSLTYYIHATGSDSYAGFDFRLDNLRFNTADGGALVYRVDDYTGTPAWTEITPTGDFIPRYPYGIAVDKVDPQNVELVGADENDDWKHFTSDDRGATWTDNGATDYRFIKRASDILIAGGENALDLSLDAGATWESKLGNLAVEWGSVGTLKYGVTVL